eukprot:CAMPEP_0202707474 /NCGR_PEP_ID=MMETSP1385-20130828/19809_1 /ASSEMBLY_ACC=CAM_ASM_000861 /TAXON_ID=933848 /ORGANISM="Elphidium margaritaceum" /LENGTH=325 /DNA_ID=CAMNT_0049366207 /DNA_START=30 /DNA_END=1007 /DNA_ORIENTATION=+
MSIKPPAELTKKWKSLARIQSMDRVFSSPRTASYAWCAFVATYWTLLVIIPGIVRNVLNSYEYWIWFLGMIGVCSMYYCTRGDFPADSQAGKPIMALTCILISVDWTSHAFAALQFNNITITAGFIMLGHSFAILWASLFFYNRAIKNGEHMAWLSLLLQWVDIVMTCVSVIVLHGKEGACFNLPICIMYFVSLVLNLFLWFFPIMFGYSNTQKHIHINTVLLDTVTDLPVVVTMFATNAYSIHWWLFIDVAFKIIMLLRTYAYHLLVSLVLRRAETNQLQQEQEEQIALENKLFAEGATGEEIDAKSAELIKRQSEATDNVTTS